MHHRTAPNLLMVLVVIMGVIFGMKVNRQFMPDVGFGWVSIHVIWPGASAEDVERTIVSAIEPEVRFLNNAIRVATYVSEGIARMYVEFDPDADMRKAANDVEKAISRITTLPQDAEEPVITQFARFDTVSRLVISGPFSEAALKATAKRMRDELLERGIDKVELIGARDEEIRVEVKPEALQRLNIGIQDIVDRIKLSSQDVPSGVIRGDVEKQIRSIGLAMNARALGEIEIRSLDSGEKVLLRDVAQVTDSFDRNMPTGMRNGQPAVQLHIQRSTTADSLTVADAVARYVEETAPTLPPTLTINRFDDQSKPVRDRLNVLLKNGAGGLFLVLLVLFLFLNVHVAVWVAAGIPIALTATVGVMYATGQSFNLISMFALIMMLGIIVDDAIVVGEHAATLRSRGVPSLEAAQGGAIRMLNPVIAASLTTMAAFLPIMVQRGAMGQIAQTIPMVVVAVLIASLVECFLILPGHLRGGLEHLNDRSGKFRQGFDRRFEYFRDHKFKRWVARSFDYRYATLSGGIGLIVISVTLVATGYVGFHLLQPIEGNTVTANFTLAPGSPRENSVRMLEEMDRAVDAVEDRMTNGEGGLVIMNYGTIGQGYARQDWRQETGDHLSAAYIELVPSDDREVRTFDFLAELRKEIKPMPGLEEMVISEIQFGTGSSAIDIRLSGKPISVMKEASLEVQNVLKGFPGVKEIEDDLPYGKPEVMMTVTPRGKAMGFTTQSVGRQVRAVYQGAIAKRFARVDEEVTVRVSYPRKRSEIVDLPSLYVRSPGGVEVPLSEVVDLHEKDGFAGLRREDGLVEVGVKAEVNGRVTSVPQVLGAVGAAGLDEIAKRYGINYAFKGRAEELADMWDDLILGSTVALISIYIILAWVFASYSRPIVVMSIIPFGLIGAMFGHLITGWGTNFYSIIALLGMSGILVNDSIILVSTIEEHWKDGTSLKDAVINGTRDRLRAVILTSVTTIAGLLPIMFERSTQAEFIIPMAVAIIFGIAGATLLVLFLVPTVLGVQEDIRSLIIGLRTPQSPKVEPPGQEPAI